jgi:hypothetical protein
MSLQILEGLLCSGLFGGSLRQPDTLSNDIAVKFNLDGE